MSRIKDLLMDEEFLAGMASDGSEYGEEGEFYGPDEWEAENEEYELLCDAYGVGQLPRGLKLKTLFALRLVSEGRDVRWDQVPPEFIYHFAQGMPESDLVKFWDADSASVVEARDDMFEYLCDAVRSFDVEQLAEHLRKALTAVDMLAWSGLRQDIWSGDDMKMKADIVVEALGGPASMTDVLWAVQSKILAPLSPCKESEVAALMESVFRELPGKH